jgi:hypothetical protein
MGSIEQNYETSSDFGFRGHIKLDDLEVNIEHRRYLFSTWVALVGGLLKSVKGICSVLVMTWVYTDYMNAVIGALFMVKKKGENEKDDTAPEKINKKLI